MQPTRPFPGVRMLLALWILPALCCSVSLAAGEKGPTGPIAGPPVPRTERTVALVASGAQGLSAERVEVLVDELRRELQRRKVDLLPERELLPALRSTGLDLTRADNRTPEKLRKLADAAGVRFILVAEIGAGEDVTAPIGTSGKGRRRDSLIPELTPALQSYTHLSAVVSVGLLDAASGEFVRQVEFTEDESRQESLYFGNAERGMTRVLQRAGRNAARRFAERFHKLPLKTAQKSG